MSRQENFKRVQDLLEEKGYSCTSQLIDKRHKSQFILEKYIGRGPMVIMERLLGETAEGEINWEDIQMCQAYVQVASNSTWNDFIEKLNAALPVQ